MHHGGQKLRLARQKLGLTLRDVEKATARIAEKHRNPEYLVPISRLSDFEGKGSIPSIHRLYSLAAILRRDLSELLQWYEVNPDPLSKSAIATRQSAFAFKQRPVPVRMPAETDATIDPRLTNKLGSIIAQWGAGPFVYLERFANTNFTYGYIGTEDFTMYPILPPGAFVQVDETRNKVAKGGWRSQHERPIYFVETRKGYVCCWCTLEAGQMVLESHPLSPVATRALGIQEAEVVGQVVGVALRLGDWRLLKEGA